jgi:glutamyl-tRNA reductase
VSLLVVGISYRTAPVPVLERVSIAGDDLPKVLGELHADESISEVLALSTCNRVEVYADVARFHPAVAEITQVLARHAGVSIAELGEHLYVHFAEAAAEHIFAVASGLNSMVVGESQILGQLRGAYANGVDAATVGSVLHDIAQAALRVGKRVHTDTGIDRAGASVVAVALDHAVRVLGELPGRRAVIVGAGSMGALTGATLRRRGVTDIVVANRSQDRARRLATSLDGRAVGLDAVPAEIAGADVLISSTGATGLVLEQGAFAARGTGPLVVLDIALPRDIDPAVAALPGVTYVDLDVLRADGAMVSDAEVEAAAGVVADELAAYLAQQRALAVAPTVTALRARATQVVDAELQRLDGRLPGLDDATRTEVAGAVRRAVDKVLHAPTVRVKELASEPGGNQYAEALRQLFDLDPAQPESMSAVRKAGGA